ncbi:DUF6531 domain-containing protein [Sorangium sp. So ce381]|uniref:DUF6531 domain-containing protein n=1 Tax=Sorangium sp. So ce381 TaxID=3133307 RepID=UPI003F5C6D42
MDVVTGRVFTHAIPICALPGPLQFVWERSYSSAMADRDAGFGWRGVWAGCGLAVRASVAGPALPGWLLFLFLSLWNADS